MIIVQLLQSVPMAEYIVQVEEMYYKNNNVSILFMTLSFKYLFKRVCR